MDRKLYRSRTRRMIAGVCGGIAEYFNVDETIVRLGVALLTVVTGGAGLVFYFIAAIIMPENPV